MKRNYKKANALFNKVIKFFLKRYLRYIYRIISNEKVLQELEAPFIVLGNHVNNLDPFFVSCFIDKPIHFVASDEQFRNPIKKFFLINFVGAIPKKKFVSDIETVRAIINIKKQKGVIGVFPEGKRTWDGSTTEILFSTAKLIKSLKIPLVTVVLKGAHLSHPRWAMTNRRGKIEVVYKILMTTDEIRKLSSEEIHKTLSNTLEHNEYKYQEERMIKFKGKKLAEKLELYLFTCPHCNTIGKLKSQNDKFQCKNCEYKVKLNEYGYFEKIEEQLYYETPELWNKWQLDHLNHLINNNKKNQSIIEDKKALIFVGTKLKSLQKLGLGDIELNNEELVFKGNKIEETFNVKKIHGLNVQYNKEFEFYYNNKLYRFKFFNNYISAYKWVSALSLLKNSLGGN